MRGKFVMVDGIDGSGKSTIVKAAAVALKKRGFKIFDISEYAQKKSRLPEFKEFSKFDLILSAEPTYVWVGRAIREELIKSVRYYSGISIAQAFALDREILYKRILLPALEHGICVLQDRGFTSSLVYQRAYKDSVSLSALLRFEGNQLALKQSPDLFIYAKCNPKIALKRLAQRGGKKDGNIFENLEFERRITARFQSSWFKNLLQSRGTKMITINTEVPLYTLKNHSAKILYNYFSQEKYK